MAGDPERGHYSGAALSAFTASIKVILEKSTPDEAATICKAGGIPLARSPPATTSLDNLRGGHCLIRSACTIDVI